MGSYIQMIAVFAAVLGTMVVVHEFGHFLVAKLFGIRVEVFSVGFGKRLWGFKRGDTDYRLSLVPLGGYVKMAGENLDEQVTGAPDEFMSKPKWQRFCVAIAGPVMNILMALAIPAVTAMIHYEIAAFTTQPAVVNAVSLDSAAETAGLQRGDLIVKINGLENPTWQDVRQYEMIHPDQEIPLAINRNGQIKELTLSPVGQQTEFEKIGDAGLEPYYGPNTKLIARSIVSGSAAESAGLKDGDQILAVNSRPVRMDARPEAAAAGDQSLYGWRDVVRLINSSNGQDIAFTVKRADETLELKGTPKLDKDGKWKLGFAPSPEGVDAINTRLGPIAAIKHAYATNMKVLELTWMAISQIFNGKRSARDSLMGPVGIFRVTGEAAEQGIMPVLQLTALLSLNLGIFNLLPIPVLDGGLIFMLGLEAVLGLFGLPLSLKIKERMVQVGFVMLLLLMGFVIFNDISKIIPGRSAQPQVEQQQSEKPDK